VVGPERGRAICPCSIEALLSPKQDDLTLSPFNTTVQQTRLLGASGARHQCSGMVVKLLLGSTSEIVAGRRWEMRPRGRGFCWLHKMPGPPEGFCLDLSPQWEELLLMASGRC
jgi:hypothetical protein